MNDENPLSRRQLIQALAACGLLPFGALAEAATSRSSALPWWPGLQLYTLHLNPKGEVEKTLSAAAQMGYRIAELAGNYGRNAQEFKRVLDGAGLKAVSCHVSATPAPNNWDLSGDLSKLAADMHTVGAQTVVLPIPLLPAHAADALQHPPAAGFDPKTLSAIFDEVGKDDWRKTADFLNAKAAVLEREGIRMAYHNHNLDFKKLPSGKTGFEILVEGVDSKLVDFELDIGWAVAAGQDLGALFARLGSRLRMLHLKDVKRRSTLSMDMAPADAGTGMVNWQKVLRLVRNSAVKYMFVEHEPPYATTPLDAAKADFTFLSNLFNASAPK